MKIALIYESPYTPGRWRRFDLIYKHLKALGHEIVIVAFSDEDSRMNDVINIRLSPLFRMIGTFFYFLTLGYLSNPIRLLKCCIELKKIRPNVILFHYYDIGLFLILFRFLFKDSILVYDLNDLNIRMWYYKKEKNLLFRFFTWIEEVFIPKKVEKVITVTEFGREYLMGRGVSSGNIFVLNEIVEMEAFYNREAQKKREESFKDPRREKIVVWHGFIRHYQVDALATIMEGVALAQKRIPNLKLLIVGPIEDQECKGRLYSLAESLKIKVEFSGKVPTSQIPSILDTAHIGVQALPDELFARYINGVKLSEYICAGLPVLCSDLDGPSELVRGNGLLFKPGDPKDLAEKLVNLFNSDYRELMENSNKIAKEEFSKKAIKRKIREMGRFLKCSKV
jgi:glycosyltransferase involved in cell wall biosynthesis